MLQYKKFKIMEKGMKTEFEARLLEVDIEKFITKLKENNAEFIGEWDQIRKCYDINPSDKSTWIRLRKEADKSTLTIKEIKSKKIDGTKECEIEVSDFSTTDEILNKLGYFARTTQENKRTRYILNGVEIDIDSWPLIPTYVEFEGKSEEDIFNVCKSLDINPENLTTIDVVEIYEHYGIKDMSSIPNLTFETTLK